MFGMNVAALAVFMVFSIPLVAIIGGLDWRR